MKEKTLKSLKLNKMLISNLNASKIQGGISGTCNETDTPKCITNIPSIINCHSHEPNCHSNNDGCNCGTTGNCEQ